MSETNTTEATANTTAARAKTVYEKVKMADGREVEFAGKRKMDKTITVNSETGVVEVRFDFRNGKVLRIDSSQLERDINLYALGHGLSQKCGDNAAGAEDIDDIVLAVEEVITQLVEKKTWSAAREAGDSMAGAGIVIKAICEATGKDVEFVKKFLQGKLDAAKADGKKLTRQELYAGFRRPDTKTGQIIKRLEEERLAKGANVDAGALLAEIGA